MSEWRIPFIWGKNRDFQELIATHFLIFYGQPRSCHGTCAGSVTQPCLTLCDPVDCSPPGSSVHGISQARILEWVAILLCVKLEKSGSWLPGVFSLLRVSETSIDHPQQPRNRRQAEGYDVGDKSGWAVETHRDRSIFFCLEKRWVPNEALL